MKKFAFVVALIALGLTALPAARSASSDQCFGQRPNVVGTSGNDIISAGYNEATINGRSVEFDGSDIVIFAGKGNDTIYVDEDSDNYAYVCAGDGKDRVGGGAYAKIHAGSGNDIVTISVCVSTPIFKAETVTVSDRDDETCK